jgi:transcriptional regulator with XRE-family HTH domain
MRTCDVAVIGLGLMGSAATALGIEQQAVSLIENARSNPTILMVDAISRALGAQVAELFELRPRTTRPARSAETDRNSRGSRPKG